ncbi:MULTISPECIES: PP2C family protein-serine/threonine phosphatase [Acidiphilium]|jgi:protein phosphatase/serine/threonine-protein phosphatase Stp1|uniref:Protein phosphatase 2C domain protein n=3 Tax=Acidiphilium TaxID=522 RepID=A5G0A3_ACICJ|nr:MULTISPECIES: PP2C family serine/threonine-protein phosphatase [Acidiphilium]MBU6357628.1 serine/threonine-protein phosphatase [Rhodospirillales bacterium]ABQ31285.1 protein phosphatase 2C domain protein [Acidiphilium cryptum JF-5]KDM65244.1 protein phosphatase PrpC [Acidiphilium sp. JA12-A1]MBS3024859.1 serine/threonine-protein phosphatase [Acidiphilium multivorum]MDE2329140.1 serine/threonine-protein phosphatase [Rhodospirillales bacterium]
MIPRAVTWAETHVGAVRRHNEDAYLCRPDLGLWAVADGAGGHQAGEVASGMIVAGLDRLEPGLTAAELLPQVRGVVNETHHALLHEASQRGPRAVIASTIAILILRDDHFACLWAGDSRVYLLRGGELTQLTRDHSLVQALVDEGRLTPEAAEHHPQANVITRAVGADDADLELDKVIGRIEPGDRFLLCSDGLSKTLPEAEIAALLGSPDGVPPPELLIAATLARKGNDNVTAVVVAV